MITPGCASIMLDQTKVKNASEMECFWVFCFFFMRKLIILKAWVHLCSMYDVISSGGGKVTELMVK